MTAQSNAGMIRVDFDMISITDDSHLVADTYITFDDEGIKFGEWRSLGLLNNFSVHMDVMVVSDGMYGSYSDLTSTGGFSGDILIEADGAHGFSATFGGAGGKLYDGSGTGQITHAAEHLYLSSKGDFSYRSISADPAQGWYFGVDGIWSSSVWFEDPPQTVPIPSSALLLFSALLPIIGFKRWRST